MTGKEDKTISLLRLSELVRYALDLTPTLRDVWITGEVTDLRTSGGHIYLVLVEKDNAGNIVARMKGNIWRGVSAGLSRRYTSEALNQVMVNGNEVRLCGTVQYHPSFGLSFNITDIDPEYHRDTTRLQLEILAALRREGVAELNKGQYLALPPQRIAVISAEGAAGYGDFMNQLHSNPYGLQFYTKTFPAVMQGVRTAPSVIEALERIEMCVGLFDCVVIIRGGGASTDLAGFDDLELARTVAKYPLPIAVGIGHERDNTVLDFLAHTRLKTPTAVAEWLIGMAQDAYTEAFNAAQKIARYVDQRLQGELRQVDHLAQIIPLMARHAVESQTAAIDRIKQSLPLMVANRVSNASASLQKLSVMLQSMSDRRLSLENERLANIGATIKRDVEILIRRAVDQLQRKEELVAMLDPRDTLRRGYSITRVNGKAVRDASEIMEGQELSTTLYRGTIKSTAN